MAKTQSFGDKLIGSIGGMVVGILIFLVSFVVLFNTEGRTDYSIVAEKSALAGKNGGNDFVYVTGELQTGTQISDEYLNKGDYVALKRNVEMFSWIEKVETDDNDVKYYKYETGWVSEPANSMDFNEKREHENYILEIENTTIYSDKAFVGDYQVDPNKVRLPAYENLPLDKDMVNLDSYSVLFDDYLFRGYGTLQEPEVGDVRISYSVVKPGQKATVFGRPDDIILEAHHGENEKGLYRIFWGTKDDAISVLRNEYNASGWTWRIIGFFVMWMGLLLIFKPLTVAFEALPLISKLGKSAVSAVTFLAALILTTVTTLISMVLHNPFGVALIIIAIVAGGYFLMRKKQNIIVNDITGLKKPL